MSSSRDNKQHFALYFLGSITPIGFFLNAFALWVFFRRHNLRSPNVIFMVNLAVSDLVLVCSLALRVHYYATSSWLLGCQMSKCLFSVNFYSSSVFITFISVDRLLAIVYPLRSRHLRTACNATKAAVTVWLFVIILTVPQHIILETYKKQQNQSICFKSLNHTNHTQLEVETFYGSFKFTLVLILLIINIVSTFLVSLTLHRNRNVLAEINNKVNVMLLFIMSLVMFIVCFVPGAIRFFFSSKRLHMKCFAAVNCCLDPVLYYFSLDSFWKKKHERNEMRPSNVI
ncbi:hypothetical protein NL108_004803 [Boleophthalmus pectinirostris]|uniref:lysophosphatidic acid receptor 4-like n=1 Tax=Boleophthalmus pectinirostris TaxID=150288 RepID=UPI002430A192|nr:lysophosphatidic acid receptor 4-like [Boleophthalmus pectinirostris]KAJ0063672.1 hypothetical protein NL108_004803 [Boleophthalmus pectinirostris]